MKRIWGVSYIKVAYFCALLISFVIGTVLIIQDNNEQQGSFAYSSPVALAVPSSSEGHGDFQDAPAEEAPVTDSEQPAQRRTSLVKSHTTLQSTGNTPVPEPSTPTQTTEASVPQPDQPADVQATLYINSMRKGQVVLPGGSNHCDVLSVALDKGLVNSLKMEWKGGGLNSYAVYVIDGRGDPNSVWWVYEVNGKSPSYGCSHVPVEDGDNVNWKFIK